MKNDIFIRKKLKDTLKELDAAKKTIDALIMRIDDFDKYVFSLSGRIYELEQELAFYKDEVKL